MPNGELINNGNNGGATGAPKKPNIIVRAWKKGREVLIKVESKPIGKAAVRIAEGLGILGIGYGGYKLGFNRGAKSVVPTIVVTGNEVEEEPPVDEEPEDLETVEEIPVIEETEV